MGRIWTTALPGWPTATNVMWHRTGAAERAKSNGPTSNRDWQRIELIAIVGSVAVRPDAFTTEWRSENVKTRLGAVPVLHGEIGGRQIVFLTRSRGRQGVPPHLVSYKANLIALQRIGVRRILATSVVGALDPELRPGSLVVFDQFLDFTRTRLTTMFAGGGFANVDFTDPYCPAVRAALAGAAEMAESRSAEVTGARSTGTYVCVDGPRYETRAEVAMYRTLGGDVIGMTNLPEAVLARESGLCYAALGVVSNPAAGLAPGRVRRHEHFDLVRRMAVPIANLITDAVSELDPAGCDCESYIADFVPAADAAWTASTEPAGSDAPVETERSVNGVEWSFVLVRPHVVSDRRIGRVLTGLEEVASIRAVKSVRPTTEQVEALYDRDGITNLLPGIVDAHAGLPAVAVALSGPSGTCERVERAVDGLRDELGADAVHNGVHASGDPATAVVEIGLFFDPGELPPEAEGVAPPHGAATG